ncbi:helix-turn-helix domain-containing protein [Patulibacter minatonensis]|uniref:helix-turn-helix domain-containing protein n=1 Tax=Patulibacter minatonensis TaxID=298163 RepID=UPI00068688E4|nr:AraC family transcriptional regulator [Patulibacter minatonensis]
MALDVATTLPRPELAGHVGRLSGVRSSGAPERRTEPAIPGTALILALEHEWRIGAAPDAPLRRRRSFAGGIALGPAASEHAGDVHVLQVDLTPLGTSSVLGVPGAALAGEVVAFEDVVGERTAAELVERLASTAGWPGRFGLMQDWLGRRVRDARPGRPDVAWAVGRLDRTGGLLPIDELRRELGCSRRHLAARFREEVGVGPKAYARLVRFDRAQHALRERPDPLAVVAAAHGFSDQAHLTREVRAFAGVTPTAFRTQALRSTADGIPGDRGEAGPGDPVTSVQDAARQRA